MLKRSVFRAAARLFAVGAAVAGLDAFSSAFAQALERHLPPAEAPSAPAVPTPPAPVPSQDERALGRPLAALVILGPRSTVLGAPVSPGVDAHAVPRLDEPAFRARLQRFLGRPLTRKLISDIETAIVQEYRRVNHPFVEVSTPEQEVDQGTLQIRVVEFRIGTIAVAGVAPSEAAHIAAQIRLRPGAEIDSGRFSQDLDWLGRYPFRTIAPAFTPGADLGSTDLKLEAVETKPWQISAGYENSGSRLTGEDRYFINAAIGAPWLNDAQLSAQLTGSPDFWGGAGGAFDEPHPLYKSLAGRFTQPTLARQDLELTVNAVETNETVEAFVIRQRTVEGTAAYRSALSNLLPLPGDVSLGVEATRQTRSTFFGATEVVFLTDDVYQLFGEWSDRWSDPYGDSSLDLQVHASPGSLDWRNSSANFQNVTNGRVKSAAYVFGALSFARASKLPWRFALLTQLNGQYAGRAVPDAVQFGIGGPTAVRGYSLDDGAFDDGFVARNELDAPPISFFRPRLPAVNLTAVAFADVGLGRNEATASSVAIGSVGLGANLAIGRGIVGALDVAYPLVDGPATRRGEWRLDARVSLSI